MFCFHCYLIYTQQTTHESLKKVWKLSVINPYLRKIPFLLKKFLFSWKSFSFTFFDKNAYVAYNINACNIIPSKIAVKQNRISEINADYTVTREKSVIEKNSICLSLEDSKYL